MAQRFSFSGIHLVQLGRQALFCDPELLNEQERHPRECQEGFAPFLSLRRVVDFRDLPQDDAFGLEYVFHLDDKKNNAMPPRVLCRVAPFIDRRVATSKRIHNTHEPLIQSNLIHSSANSKDDFVPLRVLWSDCWRVCAAWWGVSTDILENGSRVDTDERLARPRVHAIVGDKTPQGELNIEAGQEYGPNVAQRLALAVLRQCSGLQQEQHASTESSLAPRPLGTNRHDENEEPSNLAAALLKKGRKLKHVTPRVRTIGCVDAGRKDERRFLEADQWLWDAFARSVFENKGKVPWLIKHRLSEYSAPQWNDGLVTVPLMGAQQWSRSVVCQYNPNFHFSVVVLRDEKDGVFVTLENWAVADPLAINNQWGFCVWSLPGSQKRQNATFHERLTDSGGYGSVAMTFLVRPTVQTERTSSY